MDEMNDINITIENKESNNSITIKFDDKNSFQFFSNNPDLDKLMEMIISLKENVDFNKLTIETNNKDFDKKAFETIVKKSIEKFLEDIKLNDQLLQTALKSMLDEASSQECNKENIILENITIK